LAFARKAGEEWLDEDSGSQEEVASALRSLRLVNRLFGGNAVHTRLLQQAAQGLSRLDVLEVAAGRATALAAAAQRLRARGVEVRATLLDRQASHLPAAGDGAWPRELPQPRLVQGDALHILMGDKSVDLVSCCLFCHHLGPEEMKQFCAEAVRVARVAVVINDLERTRVHYGLARLFALVDPSRLSRHDGPVSVRQAYSQREMQTLLETTGCKVKVERRYLYRLAATIWVQ
jgi:ubiquinone/menaquinone biosynthesis C-methylase UbiE